MKTPPQIVRPAAFSLIEILVSLGVVSVLAALIFGAGQRAQNAGLRMDAISRMRQVGLAVQSYVNENDGSLPGPLWSGQSPWYRSSDPRTIGVPLWSYLGAPEPKSWSQEVKALAPKAYVKASPAKDAMSFIVNQGVTLGGTKYLPWGYQNSSDPEPTSLPMKMSMLAGAELSKTWAMQDVDKTHKYIDGNASWYAKLPNQPVYKPFRLCLYFDWHVAPEPIN